ncbi:MAG: PAS domain S-box protein [Sediminibacterium sp.]|nr:PAS domain S-box protein [Sediminibacterium sp.]
MKFKPTTDKFVKAIVVVLLFLIIIALLFIFKASQTIDNTSKWRVNTQQINFQAEKVVYLMEKQETNSKQYLLTGNTAFLASLKKSQFEINTIIKELATLSTDAASKKLLIDSLSFYIDKGFTFYNRLITTYNLTSNNTNKQWTENEEGKFYIDRIGSIVANIQAGENALLLQNKKENENSAFLIQALLLGLICMVIIVIILFVFYLNHSFINKTAKELEINEKRFQVLLENNPAIIALTDDNLNSIYRSPSSTLIAGWTDEDMKITGGFNGVHPDDIITLKTTVAEAIKNPGIPQAYLSRYLQKNGQYIVLEGTATKLPDESTVKGIVFNSRDVTEKIELERLLGKASRLARIGSWNVNLLKQTVFWNDITREIHEAESNFVPDLPSGLNFYKAGPGRELITQKVKEAIEWGKPWDEELEIVTAKNNIRWIRTIGETEFVDGKCVKIFGSFQDIDQRKKAEEKIIEGANRYRLLFDTSPIAITEEDHTPFYEKIESLRALGISKNYAAYFDNHSEEFYEMLGRVHILGVNQSLLDLTGAHNLEDFVANRSKFFVSMTEKTVFKLMDLIRDGGGHFEEETKIKSLSGEIKKVVVRLKYPAAPPYNSVAITMLDVTKQKESEQKIKESEEKQKTILQTLLEQVVILDPEGGILYINHVAPGFTKEELIGSNWLQWLHELDQAKAKEAIRQTLDSDVFYELQLRFFGADRKMSLFNIRMIPMPDASNQQVLVVATDITDRKKAEDELKHSTKQLRELTTHLQNVREEERKRIAREIHDELGQQLTAIKMDLAWINKKIPAESVITADQISFKSKMHNLMILVDGSNESVRKILNELRHGILEDNGLREAIEWQGNQFTEVTGVPLKFITSETTLILPEDIANCLFRLYQESLTNIARHAKATKVISSLTIKDDAIFLTIEDDGKGFDLNLLRSNKSFGILGIKERVLSLHGHFELLTEEGNGTKINIILPLKPYNIT